MTAIITGPGPVLPPLPEWVKGRLTAIYQAKSRDDFDTAFDDFIAEGVEITVNGVKQTREQYKQTLEQQRFLENHATLKFDGIVQAQLPNTEFTQDSGLIGVFFSVTIFQNIRIRAAQVAHTITSSLNLSVEQAGTIPIIGPSDRRRVTNLDQVFTSQSGTGEDATSA